MHIAHYIHTALKNNLCVKNWICWFDWLKLNFTLTLHFQDMFEKIIVDLTAATFYWRKFKMQ